ncbi:DUF3718 domain-containing protein [Paraferrimonas sp. SM1919]|uniref:DUF3718 domain-containing protein n=1 Tax=Paraferrimonas sp. SM1919 TaxID=2662263 RepID=UPI0013D88309|nr:DUF3718 domain-containing protein [Paraferrimonas sp. SM1919]
MKRVIFALIVGTLAYTQTGYANTKFVGTDQSLTTQICLAAANGSLSQFKRSLRHLAPKRPMVKAYRLAEKNIRCNGRYLSEFALMHGNQQVHNVLLDHNSHIMLSYHKAKANK